MTRKRKPQNEDVAIAALLVGMLLGALLLLAACDVQGPAPQHDAFELQHGPVLAAPSECDGACAADHCANVVRVRDDLADAGDQCEADCMEDQIGCLTAEHEYAGLCGECQHDAAECRSACS